MRKNNPNVGIIKTIDESNGIKEPLKVSTSPQKRIKKLVLLDTGWSLKPAVDI